MKRWVIAIVSLLGVNVLATVVLATVANNGDTQVIPGYYTKAVHYDDRIDGARRAADLGWRIHATAQAGVLTVDITDAAGKPVTGAHVSATGYARAHASQAIDVELDASSAGHYQVGLPARGWCDFSVVASRGTDHLERRISVEAR